MQHKSPEGQEEKNEMAWSTIRRATDDDVQKLERTALKFCERHRIDTDLANDYTEAVEAHIDGLMHSAFPEDATYLNRLWTACVRRALQDPNADGIAHGYVGQSVD